MIYLDFETYSEAGFVWDAAAQKWKCPPGASKKGLGVVGTINYVQHPTFRVLTMSYTVDGEPDVWRWDENKPQPVALFQLIKEGHKVSGWNSAGFEFRVWNLYLVPKFGFPPLTIHQLVDSMAASRAYSFPGSLAGAAAVAGTANQKDTDGKRLLDKFSIPRNPTKTNSALRNEMLASDSDTRLLREYCDQDVRTERELAATIPPLIPMEREIWEIDRIINDRGVYIDLPAVGCMTEILEQAYSQYNEELVALTDGVVSRASELQKLIGWLGSQGVQTASLDEEHLDDLLARDDLPPNVRRALEIRSLIGSASVKKVYAMANVVARDNRLHDLFAYYGARTGRVTGGGPQPTNLPNAASVRVMHCDSCDGYFGTSLSHCPFCRADVSMCASKEEWSHEAMEYALNTFKLASLEFAEYIWGDAVPIISASLRGLFKAAPGHDLICSDYSSIEAVVIAALAGEQWRMDVFRTHGKIYEQSAASVTGVPFNEFMTHAGYSPEQLQHPTWWNLKPLVKGSHHPLRKKVGKIMELACLAIDTLVLTDRGYVELWELCRDDKVWDGVEWVAHEGVVNRGHRQVINVDGVLMTPDHLVWVTAGEWVEARDLKGTQARDLADSLLPPDAPPAPCYAQRLDTEPHAIDVYDIMNAGPRNRFTIKTNSGHLIVHNCGYQGWVGSMKAFGAEEFMTEPEMKDAILAWRKASPAIVEFWGGQERNWQPELYGTEGCFIWAFQNPNRVARLSSGLEFRSDGQRVFIKLLSGRELTYHNVRLAPSARREGTLTISYEGNNTNPKNGKVGWIRMETWGGRLVENIVQATARDIQWFGIVNLEKAGYPIVLHVYDEDVAEVPKGWGSVEEFEAIMSTMPPWSADWPIKAKGGWRKERYGK
jgi:DNA polymerase